jgi:thiamine biosynthesis lipoprotein
VLSADLAEEIVGHATAMASGITVRAVTRGGDAGRIRRAVAAALDVFTEVDTSCTRFDPSSTLMQINAAPDRWHRADDVCFEALVESHRAYQLTHGTFDPRVVDDLVRLGYARSMKDGVPVSVDAPHALDGRRPLPPWRPEFDRDRRRVRLGGLPVDLGGIGKGLAVRWAAQRLEPAHAGFLVEAGGDCYCSGTAADGGPWRIGVEDPTGDAGPIAVLELSGRACATSSIRLRHWLAGGTTVHHIIDPRTGLPGGRGLQSVTAVGVDPAWAEVTSKTLFLKGSDGIAEAAAAGEAAALWVTDDNHLVMSAAMRPYVLWQSR